MDFAANRYRVPLADVLGNPLFHPAATEKLSPSDSRNSEELRGEGVDDKSVQRPGTGSNALREEIREYVTLWDVSRDDARASSNHESLELHEWDVLIRVIRVIRGFVRRFLGAFGSLDAG